MRGLLGNILGGYNGNYQRDLYHHPLLILILTVADVRIRSLGFKELQDLSQGDRIKGSDVRVERANLQGSLNCVECGG